MLSMKGKSPVKFEFSDGVATTEVVVAPDDDQATLVAKLKRILELAKEEVEVRNFTAAVTSAAQDLQPAQGGTPRVRTAGDIPARAQADWEIIPEEER